jgi:hypothetical protein
MLESISGKVKAVAILMALGVIIVTWAFSALLSKSQDKHANAVLNRIYSRSQQSKDAGTGDLYK